MLQTPLHVKSFSLVIIKQAAVTHNIGFLLYLGTINVVKCERTIRHCKMRLLVTYVTFVCQFVTYETYSCTTGIMQNT